MEMTASLLAFAFLALGEWAMTFRVRTAPAAS